MKFGHFFIDRPIFAGVLSILIVLIGGIAYFSLPVAQYPEVALPTITVTARYPGASAEVIADTVVAPLEQEINGVEEMAYIYSQATADGRAQITISFDLGTDLDRAQVQVQNRVNVALPRLPGEAQRLGVVTRKNSPDIMLVIHMRSPDGSRDPIYITNYALLQVRDRLARIRGVGEVRLVGAREYSMRIWLDPDKIAALNMSPQEVITALRGQNLQVAGGALGQPPVSGKQAFQINLNLHGRLTEPDGFANIIVRTGSDGRFTRLRDIARVELGASDYSTESFLEGKPAIAMLVSQRPGANALETAAEVKATMTELARSFPPGLEYTIVYNPTEYIQQSINSVYATIFEAIGLVVLVVLLFLHSWRAAIIPIVTIPVSIIGTFAVMAALGFSLNNLTLFGLVLAIGIVVDDAIVVVENVERNLRAGLSAREAARKTMTEVGGALISIALVLTAVFVPTAFLEGISGQFYRQFALTIAVATIISTFNSFTLSPALSALLLRSHKMIGDDAGKNLFRRFIQAFDRVFERCRDRYARVIVGPLKQAPSWGLLYVLLIGLTAFMFTRVPTGFIPEQDQGYLIVAYQLPSGASLQRTKAVVARAEKILKGTEGTTFAVSFAGFSGATRTNASNTAVSFIGLKPFNQRRGLTAGKITADIQRRLFAIQDAFIVVLSPPPIRGLGTAGGFKMMVQDRAGNGTRALSDATWALAMAANREAGLTRVFTPFDAKVPQLFVDVDRTRAEMLNVPVANIFSALQIYLGSSYVNDFNLFSRTYRVTAQADADYRLTEKDIASLKTPSQNGAMVQLGSVVQFRSRTGTDRFPRYNLFPAAEINGSFLPGVSSGEAIGKMEKLAQQVLPQGFDYEWTDIAYQEKKVGNLAYFIFPLSVLFVFLVLAANYESWSLPLAVILIVPMCLLSAVFGIFMRGMDNNILTQIGFMVLVGLAAKNAILIVEFARQLEDRGKDALSAAVEACRMRLRPILMTSFAFIFGVTPLLLATGAGAEMRQALGTAVFFGMLGVTLFGLLYTPVFYVLIRKYISRR